MAPNFAIWNPLDFVSDEPKVNTLDLSEIHQIGLSTRQIAYEQHVELTYEGRVLGREVGDDRVDLSRSTVALCCTLAVQEAVVHMVTSWEDTSVRKKSWNFCEVTSGPLTDPHQGYDFIRKNGDFTDLGFNDSIILRIISDVQKGGGDDHSSTPPGKMSMLGSRLATPRRELRGTWMLASLFQDAMLCTHKASEPKYLPQVMGGTGVTALFDNSTNVYLYTLAYKGGAYRRIYATAVAEMRAYLYNLERGIQSAPILCPRLREKQNYFWGTYDNFVFVPDQPSFGELDDPPPALYKMTGGQNRYQNFENRLIRTRHVLTRRQAQVEWEHTRRLRHIFQSLFPKMMDFEALDLDRSRTLRARYDGALSANSALSNLLRREAGKHDAMKLMGHEAFRTLTVGKLDFTLADAMWVYINGQGENYSLNDVSLSEDIFVREEVSAEETFKVAGIPLRPFFSHGEELRPTKSKVGLYKINTSMEEWSENLLDRLKAARSRKGEALDPIEVGPIFDQDREWVNDDSGLIASCHRDVAGAMHQYTVALVSKDRRLANQMAETCNVTVIRIHPRSYVEACALRGLDCQEVQDALLYEANIFAYRIYIDTGSLSASAVHYTEDGDSTYRRTLRSTGWREGSRFSEVTLTKIKRVKILKEIHHPIIRPRRWRSTSKPQESVYSTHSSWKRSLRSADGEGSWWNSQAMPLASRRDSFVSQGSGSFVTARTRSSRV